MVNIADLKARLSAHIQHVRGGEEILVCDRNRPVARIVPCHDEDQANHEKKLIARGILIPPLKPRPSTAWPKPPGKISDKVAKQVWEEERKGR